MTRAERYRVVRVIAQGGQAEVLEAFVQGVQGIERRVAIKRLRSADEEDEAFVQRFLDEAFIASQLQHANIVSLYDFGVLDGQPVQIMEFVDGADLRQVLRWVREKDYAVPPEVALFIVTEVAHALSHAHTAKGALGAPLQIVHRDVNPKNILISWAGDVKLGDFGVARASQRASATRAGFVYGTPDYMAPEHAFGLATDGRTDVFSLGCVLHRLIAGHSPVPAERERRKRFYASGAAPISEAIPEDIRRVIARALAFEMDRRFPDAVAMARACGEAFGARATHDGRTILVDWMGAFKEPETDLSGPDIAELFDLALIDDGFGDQRTFATVPSGESFRSETVSDTLPSFSEASTTSLTDGAGAPNDGSHERSGPTSPARSEWSAAMQGLDLSAPGTTPERSSSSPMPEDTRPMVGRTLQVDVRPPGGGRAVLMAGAVLAACIGIGVLVGVSWTGARSMTAPVVAVTPLAAPPTPTVTAAERAEQIEVIEPERLGRKRKRSPRTPVPPPSLEPSLAELKRRVGRRLAAKGIRLRDLDPEVVEAWSAALTAGDVARVRTLEPRVTRSIEAFVVTPAVAKRALDRLQQRIEAAAKDRPKDEVRTYERRYFKLRARWSPTITPAVAAEIRDDARAVSREIADAKR